MIKYLSLATPTSTMKMTRIYVLANEINYGYRTGGKIYEFKTVEYREIDQSALNNCK